VLNIRGNEGEAEEKLITLRCTQRKGTKKSTTRAEDKTKTKNRSPCLNKRSRKEKRYDKGKKSRVPVYKSRTYIQSRHGLGALAKIAQKGKTAQEDIHYKKSTKRKRESGNGLKTKSRKKEGGRL